MPMLESLLSAGMTVAEAYRAVRTQMTPEMLESLRWMQAQHPNQLAQYAAEWQRAGSEPPWADLLWATDDAGEAREA